jgi:predicted DCC family thiol-disulfide oxidoreductase YuxK
MTPGAMKPWPDDDVILYDGVCVFCSRWICFIAARDTNQRFRFTAIQSDYGTRLAQVFDIDPKDPDTNAMIHGGVAYFKSDAALTVLSNLPGWQWTGGLRAFPKPLRDAATISSRAIVIGYSGSMRRALCRMRSLGQG